MLVVFSFSIFEEKHKYNNSMVNLETTYLGLRLKNPLIAASSGLTNSIENILEMAENGIGAVVLKSIFEEQIQSFGSKNNTISQDNEINESKKYIQEHSAKRILYDYLELIGQAKQKTDIPVIASINCVSNQGWIDYAKKIESAGADALELNIAILPSDPEVSGNENEKIILEIIDSVVKTVSIPVAVKISPYYSGLANIIKRISQKDIQGLVLFNRFYTPDIDIEHQEIKTSFVFSSPSDIALPLRWTILCSPWLKSNISASTGVYNGKGVIKLLLAGATTVQIATLLYKKGFREISVLLNEIENWMERHGYTTIEEYRGLMNAEISSSASAFERIQFMKHYSGIE